VRSLDMNSWIIRAALWGWIAMTSIMGGGCRSNRPALQAAPGLVEELAHYDWRHLCSIAQPAEHRPFAVSDGHLVMVGIPQPTDMVHDGPRYFYFAEPSSRVFWVMVGGGPSGASHWFGPIEWVDEGGLRVTGKPLFPWTRGLEVWVRPRRE
jgi:hypothetical protein